MLAATAAPTPTPAVPQVLLGNATYEVDIADTPETSSKGLSGRPKLAPGTGMLFVLPSDNYYGFWMKDMRFSLDLVWISGDCRVSEITANVPAQAESTADTSLPVYTSKLPIRYVLEINAEDARVHSIAPGSPVSFRGQVLSAYPCSKS